MSSLSDRTVSAFFGFGIFAALLGALVTYAVYGSGVSPELQSLQGETHNTQSAVTGVRDVVSRVDVRVSEVGKWSFWVESLPRGLTTPAPLPN